MYIRGNQGVLLGSKGSGPSVVVTYQDPALRVNPHVGLDAVRDAEIVFGQSAAKRTAVVTLQKALHAFAVSSGNANYDPGATADGRYGQNMQAAVVRVSRDFLEPAGLSTSSCRSIVNTWSTAAKSAGGDCMATILGHLPGVVPGLALSSAEISEIVAAYKEFIDAYVAEYGDEGYTDPHAIANAQGISLDEATAIAAQRAAAAAAAASGVTTGGGIPGGGASNASFPWLGLLVAGGIIGGTLGLGWYYDRKGKQGVVTPPRLRHEQIQPIPWLSSTPTRIGMPAWRPGPVRRTATAAARRPATKARKSTKSRSHKRASYRRAR